MIVVLQLLVSALWAVAFATGLAIVYGLDPYGYQEKGYPSVIASAFYNGYNRMAWALAMSWLIFACYHGYGGKNKFHGRSRDWSSWETMRCCEA